LQFVLRLGTGFVAEEGGAVIGTGLRWKQGDRHASLGMIIVSQEYQGKGIGPRTDEPGAGGTRRPLHTAHCHSAGQPPYERLGFKATGTIRHTGVAWLAKASSLC
jgi:predicted N-acetyltransferase YhbS